MKALLYTGEGRIELNRELTVRDPQAGEVIVRVVACGLCRSDLSVVHGKIPGRRRRFSDTKAPASSRRLGRGSPNCSRGIMW